MAMNLKEIFGDELSEVSKVISSSLSSEEALVEDVSTYLFNGGGKRIRPILTLLISKICNYQGNSHFFLAAAVELIHAATLLHDDVVDESATRRSRPTANFKWGNKASILVGDFLFSQSFKLMVRSGSMESLESLSSAAAIITEGEVMQLARLYESKMLTIEEYKAIASYKTAALFGASTHVGAIIANQPLQVKEAAKKYGETLGLIFQIKDDMLDYFADPKVSGKNIGDDLAQGNITLPIILAYNAASSMDKGILEQSFFKSSNRSEHFNEVLNILNHYKIEEQISSYIDDLYTSAVTSIKLLPYSENYTTYLTEILDYIIKRPN